MLPCTGTPHNWSCEARSYRRAPWTPWTVKVLAQIAGPFVLSLIVTIKVTERSSEATVRGKGLFVDTSMCRHIDGTRHRRGKSAAADVVLAS